MAVVLEAENALQVIIERCRLVNVKLLSLCRLSCILHINCSNFAARTFPVKQEG